MVLILFSLLIVCLLLHHVQRTFRSTVYQQILILFKKTADLPTSGLGHESQVTVFSDLMCFFAAPQFQQCCVTANRRDIDGSCSFRHETQRISRAANHRVRREV